MTHHLQMHQAPVNSWVPDSSHSLSCYGGLLSRYICSSWDPGDSQPSDLVRGLGCRFWSWHKG